MKVVWTNMSIFHIVLYSISYVRMTIVSGQKRTDRLSRAQRSNSLLPIIQKGKKIANVNLVASTILPKKHLWYWTFSIYSHISHQNIYMYKYILIIQSLYMNIIGWYRVNWKYSKWEYLAHESLFGDLRKANNSKLSHSLK